MFINILLTVIIDVLEISISILLITWKLCGVFVLMWIWLWRVWRRLILVCILLSGLVIKTLLSKTKWHILDTVNAGVRELRQCFPSGFHMLHVCVHSFEYKITTLLNSCITKRNRLTAIIILYYIPTLSLSNS